MVKSFLHCRGKPRRPTAADEWWQFAADRQCTALVWCNFATGEKRATMPFEVFTQHEVSLRGAAVARANAGALSHATPCPQVQFLLGTDLPVNCFPCAAFQPLSQEWWAPRPLVEDQALPLMHASADATLQAIADIGRSLPPAEQPTDAGDEAAGEEANGGEEEEQEGAFPYSISVRTERGAMADRRAKAPMGIVDPARRDALLAQLEQQSLPARAAAVQLAPRSLESVRGVAHVLGIDASTQAALLWIADSALTQELPLGWEVTMAPGTREPPVYTCHLAGVAQWEHPAISRARGVLAALTGTVPMGMAEAIAQSSTKLALAAGHSARLKR